MIGKVEGSVGSEARNSLFEAVPALYQKDLIPTQLRRVEPPLLLGECQMINLAATIRKDLVGGQ